MSAISKIIDSRQLRAFASLAKLGSFTLTARELNLTQSAISHAIRGLEEDLGCKLFYKGGKKAFLTREGKRLQIHAETILLEMGQARQRISAMDAVDHGELRIGCSTSSAQYILPTVLREFKECFPLYGISISPGDAPALLDMLEQNKIDIALSVRGENSTRITARDIFEDELYFLVSPLHPWCATGQVNRKELRAQHFILYNRSSLTFEIIENHLLSQGVRLRNFIEPGSMEAAKELVKLGLGVAIAARWVARQELETGTLRAIPIQRPRIQRTWAVMYLKSRPLNLAEETFVGLCQAAAEQLLK